MPGSTEELFKLIEWKSEYDCAVRTLNCQHKDTAIFLNKWFTDIKLQRIKQGRVATYLDDKIQYFEHFCSQHFAFEEDVITILCTRFKFNPEHYEKHIACHKNFYSSLLKVLAEQISYFKKHGDTTTIEDLIGDSLKDISRWWFYHITTGERRTGGVSDNEYRSYINSFSPHQKIDLLNEIVSKSHLPD
ncbi:hypothetical protein NNJEOMEG_00633 [Fundidesulfovibrio magnetotacticus]|uniref:Hemerythrin-like domain-containing protein n=2 Tax=Fundidesulfovibrio magnetotacticus TaxID=2730080 RepID=A0A6V8LSN7_9BACT|nr:hypothetical protein NNJEOMEG_00633 [Fundidesulfovibrio magnetotacticus]